MKKLVASISILICLGIVWAAGVFAQDQQAQAPVRAGRARHWQHLALEHNLAKGIADAELTRQINRLGSEGWELVDVETLSRDGTTEKTVFFFKRYQSPLAPI